jgi:hypothetical protein
LNQDAKCEKYFLCTYQIHVFISNHFKRKIGSYNDQIMNDMQNQLASRKDVNLPRMMNDNNKYLTQCIDTTVEKKEIQDTKVYSALGLR